MLENIPYQSTLTELIGQSLFEVWQALCSAIDEKYDMERLWNTGGKNWTYEYKYRRGGKTLCGRVRRVRPAAKVRRVRPAAKVRVCYGEVTASTSSMVEKSRPRRLFSRLRGAAGLQRLQHQKASSPTAPAAMQRPCAGMCYRYAYAKSRYPKMKLSRKAVPHIFIISIQRVEVDRARLVE